MYCNQKSKALDSWAPDSWAPGPNCPSFQSVRLGPRQLGLGPNLPSAHFSAGLGRLALSPVEGLISDEASITKVAKRGGYSDNPSLSFSVLYLFIFFIFFISGYSDIPSLSFSSIFGRTQPSGANGQSHCKLSSFEHFNLI